MTGKHQPHAKVADQRRLLDPQQERAILDWAAQKADCGTPMDKRDIRNIASDIAGKRAGKCFAGRLVDDLLFAFLALLNLYVDYFMYILILATV